MATQKEILEEQKAQCTMCKIVSGEIPSLKVYETKDIIAVMDINPAAKGHVIVMPKEHYPIIQMMPQNISKSLFAAARDVSKCVEDAMISQGTTVMIASGAAAGQQLPHVIVHIIPRESNDGLDNLDLQKTVELNDDNKSKLKSAFASVINSKPATKDQILEIVEKNSQLKEAILKHPDEFKKIVPQHPQLKSLFANVNVDDVVNEVVKTNLNFSAEKNKSGSEDAVIDALGGKK